MKYLFQIFFFIVYFNQSFLQAEEPLFFNIEPKDYFHEIEKEIKNAKKSIHVILSGFACSNDNANNHVYKILQNLVLSTVENIETEIILNSEYRYYYSMNEKDLVDAGWKLLKSSNINVNFLPDNEKIHSNIIIIDKKIILEGSMPWIEDIDFNKNFYSITKILSKDLAETRLASINKKIVLLSSKNDDKLFSNKMQKFFIPILSNNSWYKFYKKNSDELLELYILLAFKSFKKDHRAFKISISNFRTLLKDKKMAKLDFNKKIISCLTTLEKWNLLYLKKESSTNYIIKMRILENENKICNIEVPDNYFLFGYNKNLSSKEKIVYFLLLKQAFSQKSFPYFLINDKELFFEKINNIERNQILVSLEKNLLIEPYSFNMNENQNGYIFLVPKNLVLLNQIKESLIHQYGKNEVEKASFIAQSFNKENDSDILKDILYFLKEIGLMEVQKIVTSVLTLPVNHQDRNFKTVKKNLVNALNEKLKQEN